jgi:hypothetical protein
LAFTEYNKHCVYFTPWMPITIGEIRITFLNIKLKWNEEIGVFIEVIENLYIFFIFHLRCWCDFMFVNTFSTEKNQSQLRPIIKIFI